ncbi:hypothetical protein F4823DRAFT_635430, partial [Ustulina deusta]
HEAVCRWLTKASEDLRKASSSCLEESWSWCLSVAHCPRGSDFSNSFPSLISWLLSLHFRMPSTIATVMMTIAAMPTPRVAPKGGSRDVGDSGDGADVRLDNMCLVTVSTVIDTTIMPGLAPPYSQRLRIAAEVSCFVFGSSTLFFGLSVADTISSAVSSSAYSLLLVLRVLFDATNNRSANGTATNPNVILEGPSKVEMA